MATLSLEATRFQWGPSPLPPPPPPNETLLVRSEIQVAISIIVTPHSLPGVAHVSMYI